MDLNFYLAQITAVLAWLFLIVSYWKNKNDNLLVLQIVSGAFFLLNYIFLGAYTGLLVICFEMVRDYLYIKFKDDKKTFLCTLPVYAVIGIFSYDGVWSLFSILASVNDGFALTYHGKKVVFLGIITYILWIVYDLYCASYANVLAESIVVISNLIILLKTKNSDNKKIILSRR